VLAAIEKATGDFLGWFSLAPPEDAKPGEVELGYRLRKAAWGKGYATEVSRALIHKGLTERGVQRVVANTMTVNRIPTGDGEGGVEVRADLFHGVARSDRGIGAGRRRIRA
jgi:hypothetical protein